MIIQDKEDSLNNTLNYMEEMNVTIKEIYHNNK